MTRASDDSRTEQIVRMALDFAEVRIGHDGTIKADSVEVRRFAEWLDEHPDARSYSQFASEVDTELDVTVGWMKTSEVPCTCMLQWKEHYRKLEWLPDPCCPRHRFWPDAPYPTCAAAGGDPVATVSGLSP